MVVDEGAEEEVEDKVVAEVEVRLEVAHVVESSNKIKFDQLNDLDHDDSN